MKTPAICLLLLATSFALAQEPTPETPPAAGPQRQGAPEASPDPRPYDRVITKEVKSKKGLFTVHQIKDRYYYEIPKGELNKEYLWVSQIARTTLGVGYGGQALGNRVVRWERINNRILLRNVSYDVVADGKLPVSRAVQAANNDTILMSFNVAAFSKDDDPVIEVTRLYTTDVPEFSARTRLRSGPIDTTRSFIERITPFPTNIEVETTHTYTPPPTTGGAAAAPPNPFLGAGIGPGSSATVLLHYSMVKLPENPMMPRLFDERVGYFTVRKMDYGVDEHRAPKRTYITRWRLEKKDLGAALSEPVKPIIYWVDPATPAKWVPYIKKGIEDWQPAFEEAGFKHGIIAKEAPTPEQDPEWSPEDARNSVIRWLPSTIENASGPHISDPRTGEILNADIQFYHNVMNLSRDWYFVQVGPLDPRAKKLPLPDGLMGRLIEYVVAHEVGHTLGFQHNMKASATYPAEKVRDREWVHKMGHTPTLMDYSRFNYVAQPEDKIDPEDLVPGIGPYDKWATMWGYKPIPSAHTPDDEKTTLDEWARQQDKTPWLRFSTAGSQQSDPGENTEAVGDADAVKSTGLGLKNLERVSDMLLAATSHPGEPYDDLNELYGRVLGQWVLEMNHVAVIVGGFDSQQRHAGQAGARFTPVSKERQAAAVKFLNQHAFTTPSFAVKPDILRRIEPIGVLGRIKTSQQRVLNTLLNNARLARLVEQEALDGAKAYAPTDFLADVRKGIWSELDGPAVKIDAYRRNMQNVYLDLINDKLNGRPAAAPVFPGATATPPPTTEDSRAFFRGELRALNQAIGASLAKAGDRPTRLHLENARDQIAKVLDPKFAPPAPAAAGTQGGRPGLDDEEPETCWPDYQIRGPGSK